MRIIRLTARLFASIGADPLIWSQRGDALIKLIKILASLKMDTLFQEIPLTTLLGIENSSAPYRGLLEYEKLSNISTTPLFALGMIEKVSCCRFFAE